MECHDIQAVSHTLRQGLEAFGLADPGAVQTLTRYCQALLDKNREMNLTAITDPVDAANLHMLDCAALLSCAQLSGQTLIDVGTGAGFPGMVLKILVPSLELTLLDSLNKRLDWLGEVCDTLDIQGVRRLHGRAEEAGRDPELRVRFAFPTPRAVADLRLLCELCLPFLQVGGRLLAMKGVSSHQEVEGALPAIQTLGGRLERCFDYTIPNTQVVHRVVVVEKISSTPPQFPRRWSKIQKSPL